MSKWIRPRLRLWAIYRELGYVPWRRRREKQRRSSSIFKGTGEAIIPFLNDDAKRTFSHLFMRPGYMIRDYLRGRHEYYLAPFTALLVFYSVFTLMTAVVQPGSQRKSFGDGLIDALEGRAMKADLTINDLTIRIDSTDSGSRGDRIIKSILTTTAQALVLTHMDLYPQRADTPWKESLAAVEGDLRSKGIPLFLKNFLLLWIAMIWLLRKRFGVSVSGAAAASAYVLCQFCVFMFLALLLTLGQNSDLGVFVMGILLYIDYRQWLGLGNWPALKLTLKTGLIYLLISVLFYILLGLILILLALRGL